MAKKIFAIFIILCIAGAGIHFGYKKVQERRQQQVQQSGKIDVAVSIYSLAYFTQKVGGDLVNVHLITPAGTEPHEYEPTPADIITLETSKALVYNGAGMDAWADRVAPELGKKGIQILKMTDHMSTVPKNTTDPHIWLDPILAHREIDTIVQLLDSLDPAHQGVFEQNAAQYLVELSQLDHDYRNALANCTLKEIVASHDAFSYMAERYHFTVHAITGISPEAEPSAAQLASLTRLVKTKHIPTIFFETLVSPKLAQTLAQEIGAVSAVLDPIEGLTAESAKAGTNYDILMRENLVALQKALLCH